MVVFVEIFIYSLGSLEFGLCLTKFALTHDPVCCKLLFACKLIASSFEFSLRLNVLYVHVGLGQT